MTLRKSPDLDKIDRPNGILMEVEETLWLKQISSQPAVAGCGQKSIEEPITPSTNFGVIICYCGRQPQTCLNKFGVYR